LTLVAAVAWPGRIVGLLDGAPFDTPAKVVALAVVLPLVWRFHPAFLRTGVARALIVALLGWIVTVLGVPHVPSTGGRILLALVGIATSLFGIVVVLPAAYNKNAIWKT